MGIPLLSDFMEEWFEKLPGWSDWTVSQLIARTAVVYILGLILVRVGKSRLIATSVIYLLTSVSAHLSPE